MPGIARFEDLCTGHGCYPPRQNNQASEDTFVENRGVHLRTHTYLEHCCGVDCHGGNLSDGSRDTFVNNLEVGMCGSTVSCGSVVGTCSDYVMVN